MTIRQPLIIVLSILFLGYGFSAQASTLESGVLKEGICLQAGTQWYRHWTEKIKKVFKKEPSIKHGLLVRAKACNQSKGQEWDIDENGVISGVGGELSIYRWRKQFYPATALRHSKGLHSVRYRQQRLYFESRGSSYCLTLGKPMRFKTLPWEECLKSAESRWLFDLPPDPGAEGLIGLTGIDSNQDGIRDDVERFIERVLPDSIEKKETIRAMAISRQKIYESVENRDLVIELGTEVDIASDCFFFLSDGDPENILKKLEAATVNTEERARAWNKINSYFSGMSFTLPDDLSSQCSFKTEN
ncbi:MAG: hypothetical protein ACR2PX_08515 [Endozoicomonas sp.]|uniref:hypothetical protein n=1 Tax=Endozoicomonas sp. TaxID=1892382 RepID=UPI003D9B8B25